MTDEVSVQANSAVYYERRYSGYGLKYHRSVVDWMMEGIWPDQHVLDAGCGTGIISRMYPRYDIDGIDISPEMIGRCSKNRVHFHSDGEHYYLTSHVVGDVTKIDVTPASFDAVVCRSLLHHLPDHKLALAEFHRVLKPGGKLVLWETQRGKLAQWVRSKTQHDMRFSEYHHAFAPKELITDIEDAGFVVEEVRQMGFFAYLAWGFPDIIDFARWTPFKPLVYQVTLFLDYLIESTPILRGICFAIGIKAVKR